MGTMAPELVRCDVCGREELITKEVSKTWMSQLFIAEYEPPMPPGKVAVAEVHCPKCAFEFDMTLRLCSLSAESEADVN